MQELLTEISAVADELSRSAFNPISLQAGTALLFRFVTLQRPSLSTPFDAHKRHLARLARDFVKRAPALNRVIVHEAAKFVVEGGTIITHGFSRLVTKSLIEASTVHRKRFSVLVSESRPFGLGLKTKAVLDAAGIPCTVILDGAVAYAMGRAGAVFLGAEALCESGGAVSGVGSFAMALAAKHFGKPVYVLAESCVNLERVSLTKRSYKFVRHFPLSQTDLPTISKPLSAQTSSRATGAPIPQTPARIMRTSPMPPALGAWRARRSSPDRAQR